MSKRVHVLMAGPIRPTLGYVARLVSSIAKELADLNVKTHLVTWNTLEGGSDSIEVLKALFDCVYCIDEPNDDHVYDKYIQTRQMTVELADQPVHQKKGWIVGMYKMFYSYRQLINRCDIDEDEIVIRVRTDLDIDLAGFDTIRKVIQNYENNTIYIRPNSRAGNLSDWFAISSLDVFKKTYFTVDDDRLKYLASISYNAEEIIIKHAEINNIRVSFIDPKTLLLSICRKFENGNKTLVNLD